MFARKRRPRLGNLSGGLDFFENRTLLSGLPGMDAAQVAEVSVQSGDHSHDHHHRDHSGDHHHDHSGDHHHHHHEKNS